MRKHDVLVRQKGPVVQLMFVSDAAQDALGQIEAEPWQWVGQWLAVDALRALAMVNGLRDAGLRVEAAS